MEKKMFRIDYIDAIEEKCYLVDDIVARKYVRLANESRLIAWQMSIFMYESRHDSHSV